MSKSIFKNLNYILFITLITLFIWHPLLNLVLQWEGYFYLTPDSVKPFLFNFYKYPTYFNVQGIILGTLLSHIFGIKMKLYFIFEIISILFANITLFFLAKTLLKNSYVAFLSTIIFASNFFALADIHRPELYGGVFLERLPFNIPLMFGSLMLLHRYLEKKEVHFYIFSIVLYISAIFLTHFSIFFSFPFFLYPFFFRLYKSAKFKSAFSSILLALPYILTVLFFLSIDTSPASGVNLFEMISLSKITYYLETITRQLAYISQTPIVIKALLAGYKPLAFTSPHELTPIILPILITYSIGFVLVYIKQKQQRAILLTITCAIFATLFLNTLIATRLDVFHDAGSSRYYLIPSIFISIFWALVLTTIFEKKHIIAIFIALAFFAVNAITFKYYFNTVYLSTKKTETLINYISRNFTKFPQKSLIVVGPTPDFGPYETNFFTYHLGRDKNIIFMTEDVGYGDWKPFASSAAHLIFINFDSQCPCVRQTVVK